MLRGEGNDTRLVATGKGQRTLINVSGSGNVQEVQGTRTAITDTYVYRGQIIPV